MAFPNTNAESELLSSVSRKTSEDMPLVGESLSNVSTGNVEEKGIILALECIPSITPGENNVRLQSGINSLNSIALIPPIALDLLDRSDKGIKLEKSSDLEVNSSNTDLGIPLIVIDQAENNTGKPILKVNSLSTNDDIACILLDPLGDSDKGNGTDETNIEVNSSNAIDFAAPVKITETSADSSNVADTNQMGFDCKYCDKNFTNKQSLGGHQNAHKFERALEKEAALIHQVGAEYLNGSGSGSGSASYNRSSSPISFHSSLKRSYDFMSRPIMINKPHQPQQLMQHQGMHVGNFSRPLLSLLNQQPLAPKFLGLYHAHHSELTNPAPKHSRLPESPSVSAPIISPFPKAPIMHLPTIHPLAEAPVLFAPIVSPSRETSSMKMSQIAAASPSRKKNLELTLLNSNPGAVRSKPFTLGPTTFSGSSPAPVQVPGGLELTLLRPNPGEVSSIPVNVGQTNFSGLTTAPVEVPEGRLRNQTHIPENEEDHSELDLTLKL